MVQNVSESASLHFSLPFSVYKALWRQGGAENEKGYPQATQQRTDEVENGTGSVRQSGEAGRVINLALKALLNIGSGGDS